MGVFRRAVPDENFEMLAIDESHYLAQQVFLRRGTRCMTQGELAERAGMTQSQVAKVEAGHANPAHRTLVKIAYALGCNVRNLYEGDETVVSLSV